MQLSERRDTQRMAAAVFAAVLVHAGLFVGIPYLTSLDTAPLPDYGPVVVRVEMPEAVLEPPAPVVPLCRSRSRSPRRWRSPRPRRSPRRRRRLPQRRRPRRRPPRPPW